MQLVPRYLVNNRTTIVANDAGFITEYRPVYNRHLKIFTNNQNCSKILRYKQNKCIFFFNKKTQNFKKVEEDK